MSSLTPLVQISVTVLVSLASLVFAIAEGGPIPALTVPVAIGSLLIVDRMRQASVGPVAAFVLGLLAIAAAGLELALGGIEARLLSVAHLSVYLTWVILVQQKDTRAYWWLCGLSVLQIAVSALLASGVWLGLVWALYLLTAIWTAALLSVAQAFERISPVTKRERNGDGTSNGAPSAGASPALRGEHAFPARLAGSAAVLSILSLGLACIFFLLIPRVWIGNFRLFDDSPLPGSRTLTGFTEQVTLGDMGEILESDNLVMEITFFDNDTGRKLTASELPRWIGTDPFFRGTLLDRYENGRWQRTESFEYSEAPETVNERGLLRQDIMLQPIGSPTLFAAGEMVAARPMAIEETLFEFEEVRMFMRPREARLSQSFQYQALARPEISDVLDEPGSVRPDRFNGDLCFYGGTQRRRGMPYVNRVLLEFPSNLTRLRELSLTLTEGLTDAEEKSDRLMHYLKGSGDFDYSLSLAIEDPTIDPVEDFVFNRRSGHCEYFASALALMLRGVGIPARVASGFRGGQYNVRRNRFEVREWHAHAWVEAFVNGRWITLDPTPPDRSTSVVEMDRKQRSQVWLGLAGEFRYWWATGVSLSNQNQKQFIYDPIQSAFASTWDSLRDVGGTAARLGTTLRSFLSDPRRWISWQGGVFAVVTLSLRSGLVWLFRTVVQVLRRRERNQDALVRQQTRVEFYERFRRILSQSGVRSQPTQTAREFAAYAMTEL
ncbi:MAG: transglutaminaseTgpA domain-containing protein, partial [Maioricimonas sp. JB049]